MTGGPASVGGIVGDSSMPRLRKVFNTLWFNHQRWLACDAGGGVEAVLWRYLRRGLLGHPFRRHYGVGACVVDFCCPDAALVVEIEADGDIDALEGVKALSEDRHRYLRQLGFDVLHFTEGALHDDIEAVMACIRSRVRNGPTARGVDVPQ